MDHHDIKDGLVGLLSVASDYHRYCAYELYNAMDVGVLIAYASMRF